MNETYNCYEDSCPSRLTVLEWEQYYDKEIHKSEYPDLAVWIADMLKMGLLIKSELSITTKGGYEFYAQKSGNIYKNPCYVPVNRIVDFSATDKGLQLYISDGTGYYWEK